MTDCWGLKCNFYRCVPFTTRTTNGRRQTYGGTAPFHGTQNVQPTETNDEVTQSNSLNFRMNEGKRNHEFV